MSILELAYIQLSADKAIVRKKQHCLSSSAKAESIMYLQPGLGYELELWLRLALLITQLLNLLKIAKNKCFLKGH